MTHSPLFRSCFRPTRAAFLALLVATPGVVFSAEDGKAATGAVPLKQECEDMMALKQKMHADMKAQDAQLMEQVGAMNRAPDDKKVSLMAAVVTQMVEHRVTMTDRKEKMEVDMKEHKLRHGKMGKGGNMSECPMMSGMHAAKEPSGARK